MKNNWKKLVIGIIIGVIISIVTLVALFYIFMMFFLYGGPPQITEDITTYEETMSKYSHIQTGFLTFPETLLDSASDTEFYFWYQDTWDDPTCEVLLQCTYDESDYLAEIERLENTKKQYGSTVYKLLRDEEGRFPYPAYIAINGNSHSYEYALLTGDRQITYIYTALTSEENLNKIKSKYLPSNYDGYKEQLGFGEGYNIYIVRKGTYTGQLRAYQTDYTRDELVDLNEYHPVTIGYNWFTVCTHLDEQEQEIIQYCAFLYYEDEHDSFYGYPDEIQYRELEGYRFKSVELSEDLTKAIVTYYNDEEEMTMEYEIPEV